MLPVAEPVTPPGLFLQPAFCSKLHGESGGSVEGFVQYAGEVSADLVVPEALSRYSGDVRSFAYRLYKVCLR
jgi:hypothetical protein